MSRNLFHPIILFIAVFFYASQVIALGDSAAWRPKVGDMCPSFRLTNVHYYAKTDVDNTDFRGRWLVLDFWTIHCSSCLASFPKMDALQKEFRKRVQFLMIGYKTKNKLTESVYEKYKEKENLSMPCAVDTALFERWGVRNVPILVVLDSNGSVRAVGESIDSLKLSVLLSGRSEHLVNSNNTFNQDDERVPFDWRKPFLIDGNGGVDTGFLFRSVLARFDIYNQRPSIPESIYGEMAAGRFQVLGVALKSLFNYAYFGYLNPKGRLDDSNGKVDALEPILEMADKSSFQPSALYNKNLFSYSVILSPERASPKTIEDIMQVDLQRYFHYKAHCEVRKCRCLMLVASDEARSKLKTKGGDRMEIGANFDSEFKAVNIPFRELYRRIANRFKEEVILDSSNIFNNIDITLDTPWVTLSDAQDSLRSMGLDLVVSEVDMNVLVIEDEK